MRQFLCLATLFIVSTSCGLQSNSDHSGSYAFSSSSDVVDSSLYPLSHLIIIEENGLTNQTLVYLFSGQLAGANLGLKDFNQLAERFGPPASIQFKLPLEIFTGQPIEVVGRSINLESEDGTTLTSLAQLDNDGLFQSGASRWLRSTTQGVETYFGFFDSGEWTSSLQLSGFDNLLINKLFAPATGLTSSPDTTSEESTDLLIEWETPENPADYITVELLQTVTDIESELPIEVTVSTSMLPTSPYRATSGLLDEAFGQCCWSTERPLSARLTQIGRRYVERDSGSWALIHRKIQATTIEQANWTDQISSQELEDYCSAYR